MIRLIRHIALLMAPVILLGILLPVDRRMAFQGLEQDCFDHGLWIHDRIFPQERPMDVVFLGSSHTINAIDDELLSKLSGQPTVNLGYCRLGRNLQRLLLETALKQDTPKTVILEIRESEDAHSHPVFPHLASTTEVLLPSFTLNRDYTDDVWTHISYKLQLTQDWLYHQMPEAPVREEAFGFSVNTDTIDVQELNARKTSSSSAGEKNWSPEQLFLRLPQSEIRRMVKLSKEAGADFRFLFLPSYGGKLAAEQLDWYQKLAPVIMPPDSILSNTDFWHDRQHLNRAGARQLSSWLAGQL